MVRACDRILLHWAIFCMQTPPKVGKHLIGAISLGHRLGIECIAVHCAALRPHIIQDELCLNVNCIGIPMLNCSRRLSRVINAII
jgi:hypothetical protein